VRGDHPVAVGGWLDRCPEAGRVVPARFDRGAFLVGGVAVGLHPDRVDAVLAVAAVRVARRGEAPVAVVGLGHAVLDLRPDRQRVVDAPTARPPLRLRHEQVDHQRLEHAAAPGRHELHATVAVRALKNGHTQVLLPLADGLLLGPAPVTRVGEGTEHREVVFRGDLPPGDAEVAGHPRLGVEGAVVVSGVPDVGTAVAVVVEHGRRIGGKLVPEPAPELADLRIVIEAEVHRRGDGLSLVAEPGFGVAHQHEGGGEPGVVDARQERVDGASICGPGGELGRRRLVVPVVEHA